MKVPVKMSAMAVKVEKQLREAGAPDSIAFGAVNGHLTIAITQGGHSLSVTLGGPALDHACCLLADAIQKAISVETPSTARVQ